MLNGKLVILMLAASVLTGCKIEISVPGGGAVVSSTGLYGCASGEMCTIDVDHIYFQEHFTAVPQAGYEFTGWQKTRGGFCGGTDSLCNLTTTTFTPHPALMALLGVDTVFTMNPVFVKTGDATPPSEPVWKVRSNHVAVNYLVEGDTVDQWMREMEGMHERWDMGEMNPLQGMQADQGMSGDGGMGMPGDPDMSDDYGMHEGIQGEHGMRDAQEMLGMSGDGIRTDSDSGVYGQSNWSYVYNYSYEADAGNVMCQVVSGEIELQFETAMPQVANLQDKSKQLQGSWAPYHAGLTAHEAGHQEIFRRLAKQLPVAFARVGEFACSNLHNKLERVANNVSKRIQQMSEDYDVETNHGGFTTPSLQGVTE
jgi:predicted secreted Zn-dependent protease